MNRIGDEINQAPIIFVVTFKERWCLDKLSRAKCAIKSVCHPIKSVLTVEFFFQITTNFIYIDIVISQF